MTDKLLEAAKAARTYLENERCKYWSNTEPYKHLQYLITPLSDAIAAAQAEPKSEPDMRHPKIQALIGAKARREIELRLAEDLLDDPKHEISGTEGDYWYSLHDKIVELQHRAQAWAEREAMTDFLQTMICSSVQIVNGEEVVGYQIKTGALHQIVGLSNGELWFPIGLPSVAEPASAPTVRPPPVAWRMVGPHGKVFYEDVDPREQYTQGWLDSCHSVTPLYAAPTPAQGEKP